jgi:hypothetical protein
MDGANFNINTISRLTTLAESESPTYVETEESSAPAPIAEDDELQFPSDESDADEIDTEEDELEEDEDLSDEEDEEDEEDETPVAPKKKIAAKLGDKTVELDESLTVPVKINGKTEEVTLKELQSDFSGRTEVTRRFTELDKQKKQLKVESEQFFNEKTGVEAHLQLMSLLEPQEFVHHLAQLQGKDPDELYGSMVKQIVTLVNEMAEMSPKQRELYNENRKFKAEKKIAEVRSKVESRLSEHRQQRQSQQERYEQFVTEMQAMEVQESDYSAAVKEIEDGIKEGRLSGEWSEFDVLDFAREKKVLTSIHETVNNVDKGKATPEYARRIRAVIKAEEEANGVIYSSEEVSKLTRHLMKIDSKRVRETPKSASKDATSARKPSQKTEKNNDDRALNELMRTLRR